MSDCQAKITQCDYVPREPKRTLNSRRPEPSLAPSRLQDGAHAVKIRD
jgi:hypothetical protein